MCPARTLSSCRHWSPAELITWQLSCSEPRVTLNADRVITVSAEKPDLSLYPHCQWSSSTRLCTEIRSQCLAASGVYNPLEGKVDFVDWSVERSRVELLTSKVRAVLAHFWKWPQKGAAQRPCSVPGWRSCSGLCHGSEGGPGKPWEDGSSKLLPGLGIT